MAAPWAPEPTNQPQFDAYHSKADLLLYGGAAGGGKSDLLLGLALTAHRRSVIFRRTYVDLNGMEQRLIADPRHAAPATTAIDMALQSDGRLIEFGALERPGAELTWQGRPHDFIGFDEGAQLAGAQGAFRHGLAAQRGSGPALPRGDRVEPADRRAGRMADRPGSRPGSTRPFPIRPSPASCAGAACARTARSRGWTVPART